MTGRIASARPSWRECWAGGGGWALVMGANASGVLWLRGWGLSHLLAVGALFAIGSLPAFPLGLWVGRMAAAGRTREAASAAFLLSLCITTIAFVAGLYALQYRQYYAQWHAPPLSFVWFLQLVFTALSALYQFAVLGLPLLFPFGFAALLVASFRLARAVR